jgi:hypothetical protein
VRNRRGREEQVVLVLEMLKRVVMNVLVQFPSSNTFQGKERCLIEIIQS